MHAKFVGINVIFEGVKVPSGFVGRRGTLDEDGLEGVHAGRE